MLHFLRLYRSPDGDGNNGGDVTTIVKVNNQSNSSDSYVPPTIDMATALPPEYRELPAFKGKDFVSLVKEHANLQALIGQRPAGIPGENATDEEWGKFVSAMRPKDATEYVFPETEYSKVQKRSPEYEKAIREIMTEVGVPKKLFGKGVEKIEALLLNGAKGADAIKAKQEADKNTEFDALIKTTWPGTSDKVIDRTRALMIESVRPELKDKVSSALKNISNEALFALTAVLDGMHTKYIAEDNPPGGGGNGTGGDASALQTEAQSIMASPAYRDWRDPGHEAAKTKVQGLFKQIAGMAK